MDLKVQTFSFDYRGSLTEQKIALKLIMNYSPYFNHGPSIFTGTNVIRQLADKQFREQLWPFSLLHHDKLVE